MEALPSRIVSALSRFVEDYGWNWCVARKIVNYYYGKQFTRLDLQKRYWYCKRQDWCRCHGLALNEPWDGGSPGLAD